MAELADKNHQSKKKKKEGLLFDSVLVPVIRSEHVSVKWDTAIVLSPLLPSGLYTAATHCKGLLQHAGPRSTDLLWSM